MSEALLLSEKGHYDNPNNRLVLVTGANKGIRFEIARQLGVAGCTMWLGTRNPELCRKAAAQLSELEIDLRFVELDVERETTVQDDVASIRVLEDRPLCLGPFWFGAQVGNLD